MFSSYIRCKIIISLRVNARNSRYTHFSGRYVKEVFLQISDRKYRSRKTLLNSANNAKFIVAREYKIEIFRMSYER